MSVSDFKASTRISSEHSDALPSTIVTASSVPATTRLRVLFSDSSLSGFKINSSSIFPTRIAPTGPLNGISDMVKAEEIPMML